jgi:hypothetical protein
VIDFAYALIPSTTKPGHFRAVRLHGVMAEQVEDLIGGADPSTQRGFAIQRLLRSAQIDFAKRRNG